MVIKNTNDREVNKTQIAGTKDKSYLENKGDYDELITPKDKDMSEMDDKLAKDIDWESLKQSVSGKTDTKEVMQKKPLSIPVSVKKLFEKMGNPESLKFSFDYSKVRDTEFGRAYILTNAKHNLALFINETSVLGDTLSTKGYESPLNLGSSGFISIGRILSKNLNQNGKPQYYFVLEDIQLKTKYAKMPKYEI